MKINSMFSVLLGIVALVFAGCESSSEGESAITLDTYELNVDGGGGDIPLYYFVSNPTKGGKFDVVCTESWVSLKEVTSKTIVLHIDASDSSDERFAMVTIKYPGAESVKVTVLQDKQLLNKFSFAVSNVTYRSCTVNYKPLDKSRPYMANIIDKEYFIQSGVDNAQSFVEAEMKNYLTIAQANGMTLEEVMPRLNPQLIYTGDAVRQFNDMQHGSTYVVYSYGVEFSGNEYKLTTPINYTLVELPIPEMYDVSFSVNYSIYNSMANISIIPQDWTGYYSVQVAPDYSIFYIPKGEQITEFWLRSLANNFFTTGRAAIAQGMTPESFMKANCSIGSQQITLPLDESFEHMVIVFAVKSEDSAIPVMCSVPTIVYL
mgnify:CR=1 FL=1